MMISCGGGGSTTSSETTTTNSVAGETLTLTVGSVTSDKYSTMPRMNTTVTLNGTEVTTISMNIAGEVTLGGDDAKLFQIEESNGQTILALKDSNLASDANGDGVHEVDIQATSTDGQSMTMEMGYQFTSTDSTSEEKASQEVDTTPLVFQIGGKTFENSSVVNYTPTIQEDNITPTLSLSLNKVGVIEISGGEDRDFFELTGESSDSKQLSLISTLDTSKPLDADGNNVYVVEVTAQDDAGNTYTYIVHYYIIRSDYTVEAQSNNIYNKDSAVKITSFNMRGNSSNEDGRVVLSASQLGGTFSFDITWDTWTLSEYLAINFENDTQEIIHYIKTPLNSFDESYSVECTYLGSYKFKCGESIIIDDAQYYPDETPPTNSNFAVTICDKEPSDSSVQCSYIIIPVIFKD